jgi:SAM-dependent methyltransferase
MVSAKKLAFGVEPAERAFRLRLARYEALGRSVAEFVRTRKGLGGSAAVEILDIGVGRGRSRRYIESHVGGDEVRYTGLDLSPRRLDSVYKGESWTLVRADAQRGIPFADGSFDVVLCEQILEHLERPRDVVCEISRVLRPGGMAIVGVPIFPLGVDLLRRHVVPAIDRWRGVERGHVQVFTLARLRRLVSDGTGLDVRCARGFRVVSGGILAPLEDRRWWWRLNTWLGETVPWLCIEAQVVASKSS